VQIRYVLAIFGTSSGKKKDNCFDFFAGRERSKAIANQRTNKGNSRISVEIGWLQV